MWQLNWKNLLGANQKLQAEYCLILSIVDEQIQKRLDVVQRHKNINLYALALAVRRQENGPPGLEFGVMAAKNTNLATQAVWAVSTFIKNLERWEGALKAGTWKKTSNDPAMDYIAFLGNRWAPIGASNDPKNLNKFWVPNVQRLYKLYCKPNIPS